MLTVRTVSEGTIGLRSIPSFRIEECNDGVYARRLFYVCKN